MELPNAKGVVGVELKEKDPVVEGLGGSSCGFVPKPKEEDEAELVGKPELKLNLGSSGLVVANEEVCWVGAVNAKGFAALLEGGKENAPPPRLGLGSVGLVVTTRVGLSSILSPASWGSVRGGVTARGVVEAGLPNTKGLLVSEFAPNEKLEVEVEGVPCPNANIDGFSETEPNAALAGSTAAFGSVLNENGALGASTVDAD